MARIGIYGGTFNPPHLGHLRALRAFAAALRLDRVLVIPDGQPPHKALAEESPDPETRLPRRPAVPPDGDGYVPEL